MECVCGWCTEGSGCHLVGLYSIGRSSHAPSTLEMSPLLFRPILLPTRNVSMQRLMLDFTFARNICVWVYPLILLSKIKERCGGHGLIVCFKSRSFLALVPYEKS